MKVLFLVSAYPRDGSDVITPWMVETIHRLGDRGIRAEVLAPSYRGMPGGVLDGVTVHRFRYAPARLETLTHDQTAPDRIRARPAFGALVPGYVVAGSVAAARLARTGAYDVLHAFWPLPHGVLGLIAKRASGVPLVSTFFGVELTWMERDLPFLAPVLRRIVRGSDAVTAISTYTADRLRRQVRTAEPAIIPFGATVEAPGTVPPIRSDPAAPLRLLFVGRLVERKGVHLLLDALARLPPAPPVLLDVMGDGPERARLEARTRELGLSERVRFHGFIPRERLEAGLAGCDALVLPAIVDAKGDVEGLGVVLMEAMAYGRPTIASAAGGIVDIVRGGRNGLLVAAGDAGALAEAIARLRDDPAGAAAMGARGRTDVAEQFSWVVIVDRLVAVYERVARDPVAAK